MLLVAFGAAIEVWVLAKSKISPLEIKDVNNDKADGVVHEWADNNNFVSLGPYRIGHYFLKTWGYNGKSIFLWFHTFPDRGIEFITIFENSVMLSTVNNSNWQSPPHFVGYYLQTFSRTRINELWQRHVEMESYLIETGKAKLLESEISIEDFLDYYRQKQTDHIRSFTAWPICTLYWNFIGKYFWHNKSIKNQYEKSMIKLPNEFQDDTPWEWNFSLKK